jgi:hypothetical protein
MNMREPANYLEEYIVSKGRDIDRSPSKAPIPSYPRKIGARTFETHEEYLEALHDYLNGC